MSQTKNYFVLRLFEKFFVYGIALTRPQSSSYMGDTALEDRERWVSREGAQGEMRREKRKDEER